MTCGRKHSSNKRKPRVTKSKPRGNKHKLFGRMSTRNKPATTSKKQSNSTPMKDVPINSCKKNITHKTIFIHGPDTYPYIVYKDMGDGNYWMVSVRKYLPEGRALTPITKKEYKPVILHLKQLYKEKKLPEGGTTIPCDYINGAARELKI